VGEDLYRGGRKPRQGGSKPRAGLIFARADCLFPYLYMQILLFCFIVLKEGEVYICLLNQGAPICATCLSIIRTEYLNANAVYLWFEMYGRFYDITTSIGWS
jgi:hypothetical protein